MTDSVRLARYTDRWLKGTANARRIAFTGSIFALLILFNVLRPYVASAPVRAELRAELQRTEAEIAAIQGDLAGLESFEDKLDEISKTIEAAAWSELNEQLKRDFRARRIDDPRAAGNRTIAAIAVQVNETVVEPLSDAAAEIDLADAHLNAMRTAVDDWQSRHIDRPWWGTVDSKDQTVQELDIELGELQQVANESVARLRSAADAKRQALAAKKSDLLDREADTRAEIDAALAAAVPPWASNLISVEWMVKYFVWIVVAIAVYLIGTAWFASVDYANVAEASGWSNEQRADPLYSSLWTLTWRGGRGTAVTLACYAATLGLLWVCIGASLSLLGDAQIAAELRPPQGKIILAHGLMLATLLAAIAIAFRGRS